MRQYTFSKKDLKAILELAFTAGYESPIEFMEQEIDSIMDSFSYSDPKPSLSYEAIKTKKNESFLDADSFRDEFRDCF